MAMIYLNAGHGGKDPGAIKGSRKESDDVLRLAHAVRPLLLSAGHTVVMSRVGNIYTNVTDIAKNANACNADYFIALHRNSATSSAATGNEVLICSKASATSRKLAQAILKRITAVGGIDRGVKVQDHRTVVLQKTSMPAVTVELGFISNPTDNALFDNEFDAYAAAITSGICDVAGRSDVEENIAKAPDEGWVTEGSSGSAQWYYYRDGKKVAGWHQLEWNGKKHWYYFDPASGAMYASKWAKDSLGKDYYLTGSGAMAVSSYVLSADNRQIYWVGADGAWDGKSRPVAA